MIERNILSLRRILLHVVRTRGAAVARLIPVLVDIQKVIRSNRVGFNTHVLDISFCSWTEFSRCMIALHSECSQFLLRCSSSDARLLNMGVQ